MKNEKLIKENKNEFNDYETLIDFIDSYNYDNNKSLDELRDYIGEWADDQVPYYNNKVLEEWVENTDCHEMTADVCGEYPKDKTIYQMMSSDLFFWYDQQMQEDFSKLEELYNEE